MILLKNVKIVNSDGAFISDILINDGKIIKVAPDIQCIGADEEDLSGLLAFPGFVDMHCHLRDPGQTYKEDIESGATAAISGGFTAVCCMPNTTPPIDSSALVEYVRERSEKTGLAEVYPIGCITRGQGGKELCEFGKMKSSGAVAVSDDGLPVADGSVMLNALKYAATFGLPVISHSEDKTISRGGVVNEGENATAAGLRGIPRAAESSAIAREVLLAKEADAPIHIAHVSTSESVEIIRAAKRSGVAVTCETCPHYFTMTDDEILSYNTNAKINPPLRTQSDLDSIIQGLKDGTIDVIATDHAPHHVTEKNREFDYAPFGTVGLETAFSLAYTFLVKTGALDVTDITRLMAETPRKILGMEGGKIQEGAPADITIANPEIEYTVDAAKFKSKGKNSLFDGWKLFGKAVKVFVKGVEKIV